LPSRWRYRKPLATGQPTFAIGFAVSRSRDLFRDILHVTGDARRKLGQRVVEHLETSGRRRAVLRRPSELTWRS
jgi:hypothetical protein